MIARKSIRLLLIFLVLAVFISHIVPLVAYKLIGSSLLINKSGFSQEIYDKDQKLLRITLSSDDKLRIFRPLDEINPAVIEAFMEQEDRYFYWHPGINPFSALRAFITNIFSDSRFGASTLSMQLARLRFGIHSRSFGGKIKQMLYAVLLEFLYSKHQILEAYLNTAPFGGNIEGIEAASFTFFGKGNNQLNCAESIALAVIPQNPNKRFPDPSNYLHLNSALKLAEKININQQGFCQDYQSLLKLKNYEKYKIPFKAEHFTERLLKNYPDNLNIVSSLDSKAQTLITRISTSFLSGKDKLGLSNTAVLLVENSNLKVRAYLGSADFWSGQILGQNDGLNAKRSPGSALKPFLYALGLDQGLIHPGSLLKDTEFSKATYDPENFEKDFIGPISATDALIRSRNIPAVALLNQLGPEKFYGFLKQARISRLREAGFYGLSLVLGGVEVSAMEMAKLYASLANGGKLSELSFLEKDRTQISQGILSPEASFLTLKMLEENPRPLSSLDSTQTVRNHEIAWKTGTSFGFRDAWAAGIVGKYTLVVWIGNFNGSGNPAFIGRDSAGILFFRIADAIYQPDYQHSHNLNIKKVKICPVSGELPGPDCPHVKDSWFIPGVSPIKTCSLHRAILINPENGLRSCEGKDHKLIKKVYEFWPSDLAELFIKAGLGRAKPPEFEAGCSSEELKGQIPLISSPQSSITYQLQKNNDSIPLNAVTDASSSKSFWFADDILIGEALPAETIFWKPRSGDYLIRVVDSAGRSNQVNVKVQTAAALR